jgi:hypothetical protein
MIEVTVTLNISEHVFGALDHISQIKNITLGEVISKKLDPTPVNWCSDEE